MAETALKKRAEQFLEKHFSGESINYRQIIAIIIPVLVDQAFVIILNLVNTAMISSSGVAAVSAVNMVDSLNIFLVNVYIAVSTGGTVVVAQYKGSGNDKMVSKSAAGSLTSVFTLAFVICMFVVLFHTQTINLLFGRAEQDVIFNARIYLLGSCASYCGIAMEEAVCGVLRGVGETRSSLTLSLIMNLSYVSLNFLCINVLHMGIYGLVVSMNAARYLAAICALIYLTRTNYVQFNLKDLLHFDFSVLKKISFIGLPFAAEQMFFNGGKILTQTFIVNLGTFAIATNAICGSIAALFQIPANALCLSIITVVGQCMGRRDIKDAKKFIRSFLWLSSISFFVMAVFIFPFFNPLVSLFHPPAQIVHNIFIIVLINAIAQIPLWSIAFLTPSALRAAGDSKFTSIVSMLSMWFFRVVLGYILGIILHFGIVGVWLAMDCEWGVRGAVFMRRYLGKKWYQHHVID